jgi:hypothetical protein
LLDDGHSKLPVALVVNGESVRLIFDPGVPDVCRRLAVGFSPLDSMPTRGEWIGHALPLEEDAKQQRQRAAEARDPAENALMPVSLKAMAEA